MSKGRVVVLMGSDSDLPIMQEAINTLKEFEIEVDARVLSCHRAPHLAMDFARSLEESGYDVVIAGAGGAAHLPGVIAALTTVPVIGVPIPSGCLNGMDALFSIVQMPGGIPVATMAIGKAGARNAAIFAAQILAVKEPSLCDQLREHKKSLQESVESKNAALQKRLSSGD